MLLQNLNATFGDTVDPNQCLDNFETWTTANWHCIVELVTVLDACLGPRQNNPQRHLTTAVLTCVQETWLKRTRSVPSEARCPSGTRIRSLHAQGGAVRVISIHPYGSASNAHPAPFHVIFSRCCRIFAAECWVLRISAASLFPPFFLISKPKTRGVAEYLRRGVAEYLRWCCRISAVKQGQGAKGGGRARRAGRSVRCPDP